MATSLYHLITKPNLIQERHNTSYGILKLDLVTEKRYISTKNQKLESYTFHSIQ